MSPCQQVFAVFFGSPILMCLWAVAGCFGSIPEDAMVAGFGILGVLGMLAPLVFIVYITISDGVHGDVSSPVLTNDCDYAPPRINTEADCADHGYQGLFISPYPSPPVAVFGSISDGSQNPSGIGLSARLCFFGDIASAKAAFPSAKVRGFGPDQDDPE